MGHKFLSLPGTSGHYADTPDINELEADTSHVHQSLGNITGFGGATRTLETDFPLFGANSVKCVTVAAVPSGLTTSSERPAASQGETWTTMAYIYHELGVATDFSIWVYEHNGTGQTDSGLTNISVPDKTWTPVFLTRTLTAADTTGVFLYVRPTDSTPSTTFYAGQFMVAEGTHATFVPSLRIVGDLDMRTSIMSTTPGVGDQFLIDTRTGVTGFTVDDNPSPSTLFGRYADGTDLRSNTATLLAARQAGTIYEARSVYDISAGEALWYLDAVLQDTNTGLSTLPGSPSNADLHVGAVLGGTSGNFGGRIYWAEVRDGIAGPVVARFDPDDFTADDSDGATAVGTIDGRTWTLHGASSLIESPLSEGVVVLTDEPTTGLTLTDE